jgi:hypothetical protein
MVYNTTFNNISVISLRSVLLMDENHRAVTGDWQALSHNVVSNTLRHERDSNSWWYALVAHVVVNPTTYDHDQDGSLAL